jgi:hypothetical protein
MNYQFDLSSIEAAVYFIDIKTESGTVNKQVIKKAANLLSKGLFKKQQNISFRIVKQYSNLSKYLHAI